MVERIPKSIRVSTAGAGDGTPVIQWCEFAHELITKVAARKSGIPDDPVGKERTVRAPWGQNPFWTTQIHEGDTVHQILEKHSIDPDLFAIEGIKQLQHGAIVATHSGEAPYLAQQFVNKAIQASEPDMKYLYLAWAMHFLEDCGMAYHTTLDPVIQTTHLACENYIDSNLTQYYNDMAAAPEKDIKEVYRSSWQLAEFVNPYAPVLHQAWLAGDYDIIHDIAKKTLAETTAYATGAIRNINDIYLEVTTPTVVQAVGILLPAAVVVGAAAKGR